MITRRHAALCLAGALLLAQLPACASRSQADGQLVSMSIVDRETGQAMTAYRKDGRTYVAGRPASRYTVRLANQTGGRVMVVLSVDGVNVITGETASVGQTGYVLEPWQSYDIAGWRKSETAIASFVFAALGNSYAARTGRPGNVGVIGMAAFVEKPEAQAMRQRHDPPSTADRLGSVGKAESRVDTAKAQADAGNAAPPATPAGRSADNQTAGEIAASATARLAPTERLGTGHGQREWSVSRRTSFEKLSSTPQDVVEITYDSYANLVLAGVIPTPTAQARAFPSDGLRGFVPDPPSR
ncbi:MAG: hypothetical protein ACRC2B_17310 [Rubrivivax sp.]